ncbi:unnamed protein product [Musa acuminata subsp. malaccensis]|uniref:(wild Malaysian banana) hypothetical protein n=1 Tax=Musa acuminata subsp. malaccensis TaxID=214687 RepID=A0A804INV0_MUSAM|nr:unnamed protein product [Musa acuminata subsp. malaccensis]
MVKVNGHDPWQRYLEPPKDKATRSYCMPISIALLFPLDRVNTRPNCIPTSIDRLCHICACENFRKKIYLLNYSHEGTPWQVSY